MILERASCEKGELRKRIRRRLRDLKPSINENLEFEKQLRVFFSNRVQGSRNSAPETWGVYAPLPGEPDLLPFLKTHSQCRWAFPRIDGNVLQYFVARPDELAETVEDSEFALPGLRQPRNITGNRVELADLAGVLVPALAIDRKGYRLGRGKGYYDRTFQRKVSIQNEQIFVAAIWSHQLIESIGHEEHDLKVDAVMTEKGLEILSPDNNED